MTVYGSVLILPGQPRWSARFDVTYPCSSPPAAVAATGSGSATSSNNTIVMSPVEQFDALMDQIRKQPVKDESADRVME